MVTDDQAAAMSARHRDGSSPTLARDDVDALLADRQARLERERQLVAALQEIKAQLWRLPPADQGNLHEMVQAYFDFVGATEKLVADALAAAQVQKAEP